MNNNPLKEKFYISHIDIKNFKGHKEFKSAFAKKNEIFGKNHTGKTSILDAIKFIFYGGKRDVDKIRVGEDKAKVDLTLKSEHTTAVVTSYIDKLGVYKCKLTVDGIETKSPRAFLTNLLSVGNFDPKKLMNRQCN